jgi:hypothetical protein
MDFVGIVGVARGGSNVCWVQQKARDSDSDGGVDACVFVSAFLSKAVPLRWRRSSLKCAWVRARPRALPGCDYCTVAVEISKKTTGAAAAPAKTQKCETGIRVDNDSCAQGLMIGCWLRLALTTS